MKTPLLCLLSLAALSAAAAPKILSPAPEWNAGEARIGTKLQHTFTIKNEGDQPLKINEVKPGCGCTTANLVKSELLPGESTTIEAALDLAMRRGLQNKTIHVKTNDPATPDYVLMIKVFSKDDFKLQPEYIDLGPVTTGIEIQRKATLTVTSEKPWKITEIASTKKLASATYVASADGKEYTITVTVPPQTAVGTFFEVYECADGRHLAVGPLEPQFYIELLRLLDLDLPDTDPRHPRHQFDQSRWPEAKLLWEKLFKTRTRDEWSALLEQTDACVAPVLGFDEARHHPHFVARTAYRSVGGEELPVPAPRFGDAGEQPRPVDPVSAPVAPGTDSDAILTELGWSIAKIAAAREQRAVSG